MAVVRGLAMIGPMNLGLLAKGQLNGLKGAVPHIHLQQAPGHL
jgi:hypothetical protein